MRLEEGAEGSEQRKEMRLPKKCRNAVPHWFGICRPPIMFYGFDLEAAIQVCLYTRILVGVCAISTIIHHKVCNEYPGLGMLVSVNLLLANMHVP